MPVPLSVMQAAAQGDKKAMRLVEQEYGVGDGQNYAIDYLSEEEPPPRVPAEVKGVQGRTQGKGYPSDLAKLSMEREEEYQKKEEVASHQRKADQATVEQYMQLQDSIFFAEMAEDLYTVGLSAEVINSILAPATILKRSGRDVITGTQSGTRTTKDPTPTYTPYTRERVMLNLQNYIMKTYDKPVGNLYPLEARIKRSTSQNVLNRLKKDEDELATMLAFLKKKGKSPERLEKSASRYRERSEAPGTYEKLSEWEQRSIPKEIYGKDIYRKRTTPYTTTTKVEAPGKVAPAEVSIPEEVLGKELLGIFPAYNPLQESKQAKITAQKQLDILYQNASPEVKRMIDSQTDRRK